MGIEQSVEFVVLVHRYWLLGLCCSSRILCLPLYRRIGQDWIRIYPGCFSVGQPAMPRSLSIFSLLALELVLVIWSCRICSVHGLFSRTCPLERHQVWLLWLCSSFWTNRVVNLPSNQLMLRLQQILKGLIWDWRDGSGLNVLLAGARISLPDRCVVPCWPPQDLHFHSPPTVHYYQMCSASSTNLHSSLPGDVHSVSTEPNTPAGFFAN